MWMIPSQLAIQRTQVKTLGLLWTVWPNESIKSLGKRTKFPKRQWNFWDPNWEKAKELAPGLPRDSSQGVVTTTKGSCIVSWNGKILLHLDRQLKLIVKQLYETLKGTDNNALVGTGECQETFLTMKKKNYGLLLFYVCQVWKSHLIFLKHKRQVVRLEGLPWQLSLYRIRLECRRPWFESWVWKIPWRRDRLPTPEFLGFPGSSDGKEFSFDAGDLGSTPGLGRSSGEGNGNPLQYSCLENPMDGGAC